MRCAYSNDQGSPEDLRYHTFRFVCYRRVTSRWVHTRNIESFFCRFYVKWQKQIKNLSLSAGCNLERRKLSCTTRTFLFLINFSHANLSCPSGRNPRRIFVIVRRNKQRAWFLLANKL